MEKKIWFDMDGTIADLYGVPGWLDYLEAFDPYPYYAAKPLLNLSLLARYLNRLQREGWTIGIISYMAKKDSDFFGPEVKLGKLCWLHEHFKSISWDEIKIVKYGVNKYNECGGGILFDDEERNRDEWLDESYEPSQIFEVLKGLME